MHSSTFEDTWRSRYERWATQHRFDHQIAGWSEEGLNRRITLVLGAMSDVALKSGSRILDLGSGPGTYVRILKERGFTCFGLDYSWNVISVAKSKDCRGSYLQAEAYHLPFQKDTFDALTCVGVTQSLALARNAISEMSRVLKPEGYLFLDGLNSLFWLHAVRSRLERIQRRDHRMSYYSPFALANVMKEMGLRDTQIYWLTIPVELERWFPRKVANCYLTSFCFGYAFLIRARKLN